MLLTRRNVFDITDFVSKSAEKCKCVLEYWVMLSKFFLSANFQSGSCCVADNQLVRGKLILVLISEKRLRGEVRSDQRNGGEILQPLQENYGPEILAVVPFDIICTQILNKSLHMFHVIFTTSQDTNSATKIMSKECDKCIFFVNSLRVPGRREFIIVRVYVSNPSSNITASAASAASVDYSRLDSPARRKETSRSITHQRRHDNISKSPDTYMCLC